MLSTYLFYLLTTAILISSFGVITFRSPIHSVLSLVATLCLLSGYFILLKAYLVAMVMLLVYAGAILVLFLFITMLVDFRTIDVKLNPLSKTTLSAGLIGVSFITLVISTVRDLSSPQSPAIEGTTAAIGRVLFERYSLPFELTAFLILSAVVAIVVLAKRDAA